MTQKRAREEPTTRKETKAKRRKEDSELEEEEEESSSSDSSESESEPDSDSSDSSSSESSDSSSDSSDSDDGERPPASVKTYTADDPPKGKLYWYWTQRHRLFSRYDSGVWMTNDSWFEVTPEKIARQIAEKMLRGRTNVTVVDAFSGIGGNAIQFAMRPECAQVIALDTNADALACSKHNAELYGVREKIVFMNADYFEMADELEADMVFLSPPWGGPKYRQNEVFDLETMEPYGAGEIVHAARKISGDIALYVPRTSDLNQLAMLGKEEEEKIEAVHYCLGRKSKALTAYFGSLSKHAA